MIPDSIRHIKLNGQVWNAVIGNGNVLFLDLRGEKEKSIELCRLDLTRLDMQSRKVNHSWWTQLKGVDSGELFFIEYEDRQDPTRQHVFSFHWETGERQEKEAPDLPAVSIHPCLYELGTDYHQTVSEFLSLELPLACEYLEWNNKIIISYYLRSGSGFDRFLLLLKNGQKEWKILQDTHMKGFSPGAFFVLNEQIIFIKDQNEVCVYNG